MYTPKYAQKTDMDSITEFIARNGFGILVSQAGQKLVASHIPMQFSPDGSKLVGHVSKANPQWKNFIDQTEVLAIFSGPHTYISSSWYDHENVPTWNYIAAHVYGRIQLIKGIKLYQSLKYLLDKYESASENPVSIETMSPEYVRKSIQGLVGFEISITSVESSYKLSQNRDPKNQLRIIHELEKKKDEASLKVALEMKKNLGNTKKN